MVLYDYVRCLGLKVLSPKSAAQAYACEAKHAWMWKWMVSFSWLCLHTIFLTLLIYICSMIEAQGSSLGGPWRTACHWHRGGRLRLLRLAPPEAHAKLPREPDGSERLMPCSGWSTPVYLQHGGLQSWSSLVLLASDRFGQPSRTSGNIVASRPRSQHCHLRLPGSSS